MKSKAVNWVRATGLSHRPRLGFLLFLTLLTHVLCTVGIAESQTGKEDAVRPWMVTSGVTQNSYLLREPVLFQLFYRNSSDHGETLRSRGPLPLAEGSESIIVVTQDRGENLIFMPLQYRMHSVSTRGFPEVTVAAGETEHREEWLVVGVPTEWERVRDQDVVDRGVSWLFPEADTWTVALRGQGETAAEFEVLQPEGSDLKASTLFDGAAASAFASGYARQDGDVLIGMRRLVREYPRTAYAPFAAIILARAGFRQTEEKMVRPKLKTLQKLLDPVFEHHANHPLHAEALYLMFQAAYHARSKRGVLRELALQLVTQHPYSSWSIEIRKDFTDYLDLPPAPPWPAATQPAATQPVSEPGD